MAENFAETKRMVREPEAIYQAALSLRRQFATIDADPGKATLLMDMWTRENFMRARDLRFGVNFDHHGRPHWHNLQIEVRFMAERLAPYVTDAIPAGKLISRDDDPFLLSIRYEKERSGRIAYLDHPDVHSDWK
jgi:hypothetical protein